ncbi:MAG: DUF362 domain-containing protein [candidate division KSB1 bacterium]|nr:DUF362 domain-containing protein [candidate division KSB1 bacterium]MDZ7356934.1 DUF362 domain-containing protein [candidate division KSB1 bacterium]MDZ7400111.1 DUF362 domain-containing protein [candidate division KSB1 bacterium]
MSAKVYFMPATAKDPVDLMHRKLMQLYEAAQLRSCFSARDMVAIKIHFGEEGNSTHVAAEYLPPLIAAIRQSQAEPFLTETCVLYRSQRANAVSHVRLAEQHGFGMRQLGVPIIIADGLRGNSEIEVKIPGKLFSKVAIAAEALMANAMLVISHVTGHMASGLGAAIKNLGMGLASRKGKLRQHSSMKPRIEITRCTGCGECILWCPETAITMNGNVAVINEKICIGCGECLTVCRFDAVKYNWKTSSESLQRKMAEHALGAVIHKKDKVAYLNFLINITKDCDCLTGKQPSIVRDIGVLASRDPVAIDKASLDLIAQYAGKSLAALSYPHIDPTVQLQHGQEIGLGSMDYELISLDAPTEP